MKYFFFGKAFHKFVKSIKFVIVNLLKMSSSTSTASNSFASNSFASNSFVNNISLYIPYLQRNVTEEMIKSVFLKEKIGIVKRVDFIPKLNKKNQLYNCAFVHFEYWFENKKNIQLQRRLKNTEIDTRIIHNNNPMLYWTIKENNSIVYNLTTNPAEEKVLGSGYVSLGSKRQRITIG